jgi:hypothetical protein
MNGMENKCKESGLDKEGGEGNEKRKHEDEK